MAERATRQMLDGISAFRDAYKTDPKFKGIIGELDSIEQQAEKLVPAAYDRTADEADQPDQPQPTNLKDAGSRARQALRAARKQDAQGKQDAEDAKDGGKDEATEGK